ncbi:MAG: proprotein convertase P-domain-containing protein, partial [Bacteroidales bacterium]|nr:proprotein convertase P-domain-containing protein [Bacteroidales bacterium]
MKKILLLFGLSFFLMGFVFGQNSIKDKKQSQEKLVPEVHTASYFDVSPPLSQMAEENQFTEEKVNIYKTTKNKFPIKPEGADIDVVDPLGVLQQKYSNTKAETIIMNGSWDGATNTSGVAPPDTDGDVSPDYYVQAVNNSTQIFDRVGNTVAGPFNTSTFWSGFGIFAGTNDGDPIVLWDENAGADGRWIITQFAVPATDGKMYELIAVSQTSDPTGSYNRYAFEYTYMPDYPKFAIWPDGYYCGYNAFDQNNGYSSEGVYVSAFERDEMIAGNPAAREVRFLDASTFALFPADADVFPALGTPCYFVNDMVATYTGNDEVYIYEFDVDWSNTANSTFGLAQTITVTPYGFFGTDTEAPQSGTTQKLDLLHYRTMYRAYYRPFGTHNSIVLSRTVDPGTGEGAVRWYEFRNVGVGAWSTYQEGTYSPNDGKWRWMPSIAMNGNGDIALGYSISSTSSFPSIAGVARYSTDPLNVMTTNESVFFSGSASQTGVSRWGDYAMLSVDPTDDYSFWFTTEYSSGGWNWRTRIIHFSLPVLAPPSVSNVSPTSLYEDRGKQLTITGSNMVGCTFSIGGVAGSIVSNNGSTAVINFPAGNYTNGTLTVTNGSDTDNSQSITINTRNTIPVIAGSTVTSDNHPTIESAVDGLFAWYGTTAFTAGDLSGTKTIDVYAGTYTEGVSLTSGLNPTVANPLIIQNHSGDVVVVDATGNNYGFDLSTVDYVQLKGFTVHSADIDNIYAQGDNVTISYNKSYGSVGGSGIKVETGTPFTVINNLAYSNYYYGIHVNGANNIIKNNTTYDNGHSSVGPQVKTYTFTGSVAITDLTSVYGDISVSDNFTITNVRVLNMNITHTYDGDLDIYLDHPDATEIMLSTDNGVGGDNYENSNFDDAAATAITAGTPPFTGTFRPEASLTGFDTKNSSGTWRLRVYDDAAGDVGTLTSWTLELTYDANEQIGAGIYVESGTGSTVENNILVAKAGNDSYFSLTSETGATVSSDYNTYYTTNTNLFDYNGTVGNTGPIAANDITTDPDFVNAGTDFHIKSTAGSYAGGEWPPLTAASGSWTLDGSDSPAIDAGNTSDAFGNEPASNGGVINQGAYGNTLQASKSPAVVVAHNWTGNVSTDWQTAGNWDLGTIPTATNNVVIPNGRPRYPLIDDGTTTALCDDISIESAASVTIATNGEMTVAGAITNAAGTSGLVIQSDATGTGSLIQNSVAGVNATVQQLLAASSRAWHMMGSPISNATVAVYPSTTYLYYYDESIDDYWTGTVYDSPVNGWTNYTAGALNPTSGYLYNDVQTTIDFAGSLNTSTSGAGITIDYTNSGVTSGNGSTYRNYDGWNLVSNPFTSAIDWTVVNAASANLYDAIYTW